MTALVPLPKLRKLVPLLGSDKPGEVVAAASAIGRALRGADLDWHDLADAIERQFGRREPSSWQALAERCLAIGDDLDDLLTDREITFLRSIRRWRGPPSPKQVEWLTAIAASLGVAVAA